MPNNKIFILLPDGIGLRNFAYTDFYKIGKSEGYDIIYWNNTPFDLLDLGFSEIKIKNARANPLTDIYKNIKIQSELNLNIKKTGDKVYDTYRFPFSYSNLKKAVKSIAVQSLTKFYFSHKGLKKIREKMNVEERKTAYYRQSLETLKEEKPSIVFCTNQRPVLALAPLLAAQELGIPTATFIYSWDNLPKATMVVETDYYFVWSDHMKKELLNYYPYIQENQIFVTGTPQFEPHFNLDKIVPKEHFFQIHGLDINKKYICYSGDDITSCPDDPQYLSDVATAVRQLNRDGNSLGIIFRRCPVDFSNRFDEVLEKNKDIITPIKPKWDQIGEGWNAVLPTKADLDLQINTIYHTEMVINLGSSMVFDYVTHKKPCAFVNYDVKNKVLKDWSVSKIYNFVHFRSMPNKNSVIWLNSPDEIVNKIKIGINNSDEIVRDAQKWFEIINQHPPQDASKRIWEGIKTIISKE
jgi:hypothetical protein